MFIVFLQLTKGSQITTSYSEFDGASACIGALSLS